MKKYINLFIGLGIYFVPIWWFFTLDKTGGLSMIWILSAWTLSIVCIRYLDS